MKKIFFLFAFVFITVAAFASDNIDTPYYQIKWSIFEAMPRDEEKIVFLGDSLTDYVKFDELVPELKIKNRGIAGDTTVGVLKRLDEVISLKPSKLFLLIGTNDIVFNRKPDEIVDNIKKIIEKFREKSPNTAIYVQTLFPVNHNLGDARRPKEAILAINEGLSKLSDEIKFTLIDTYSLFAENDELPERYTVDGLHLNGAGIVRWVEFLREWLQEKN
ncbi:MAG: hypothetical protein IJ859_04355 [Synergistaceae bacterium]|nr:hypothetical protein [Synergistaceae bacterium]